MVHQDHYYPRVPPQDLTVVCSDGVHVQTSSSSLLATWPEISTWLQRLPEEVGEDFYLCLPSITARQLENLLTPSPCTEASAAPSSTKPSPSQAPPRRGNRGAQGYTYIIGSSI